MTDDTQPWTDTDTDDAAGTVPTLPDDTEPDIEPDVIGA